MLMTFNRLSSDPFEALWREFNRASNGSESGNGTARTRVQSGFGAMSVWETESHVHIEFDVPGVPQGDIDLVIEDGSLRFRVERKAHEHEGKQWYDERGYGRLERSVTLPDTVDPDSIEATLEDGVLKVSLGRRPESQPKKVTIQSRHSAAGQTCLEHSEPKDS